MVNDIDRREAAIKRLKDRRGFWQAFVVYVVVNTFLVVIWALTGAGYFWPIWVIAPWGIGVVMHAYTVFLQRPITEADVDREMQRDRDEVA